MSGLTLALLAVAGVGAGLAGSIAGLASLVSYPALLAAGLGPVVANITNTVALIASSIGSVTSSQPELKGQARRGVVLGIAAVLGGVTGALLLLVTDPAAFTRIVPVFIGSASLLILWPPRVRVDTARPDSRWLPFATYAIGIYGGYFGAAAGVVLLAALLAGTNLGLVRSNAMKNLVMGLANAVAAVIFVVQGKVEWHAALPLAAGFVIGAYVGPKIVRRSNVTWLRIGIGVAGLALAVVLAVQAYR